MSEKINFKKISSRALIYLVLGFLVGAVLGAPLARASFLGDLWQGLKQLGSRPAPATPPSMNNAVTNTLYKPVLDYERAVVNAVKSASPAVVSITISKNVPIIEQCQYDPFSNIPPEFRQFFGDIPRFTQPCASGKTELREVGGGSGFIVSGDGMIVTNKHVVADTEASYTVFTNDGKKYDASVLARDPAQDLAVLKIQATGLPTLPLGDSDAVELGQSVIAIGNALGEFRNTVSVGVISGLARTVTASDRAGGTETIQGVFQTDAAINPGNSGGPLLNLKGQVIAINTAVASGAQNIGFAIPVNRVKRSIQSVETTGEIQTPYLGIRYTLITPALKRSQNLPVDYGALVRGNAEGAAVLPNSPAAKAGIRADDIVLSLNNKKITAQTPLGAMINELNVGDVVTLKVLRDGRELTLRVTLAKRPQ